MQEIHTFTLERSADSDSNPTFSNQRKTALIAILQVTAPDNDLVDDNPLPYGHTAFTEEECELWVCRVWIEGAPVAYLTVQTTANMLKLLAVHDCRFDELSKSTFKEVMLCLVAGVDEGLMFIGVPEEGQVELQELFGPVFFDMHNNARIQWSDYERHQQRHRQSL